MATTLRNDAKKQLIKRLREQGYPTYARLLNLFDIYLTDNPNVIGYMIPGKAKIVLNNLLSLNQVSTIVRHEILHEFFVHAKRRAEVEINNQNLGSNQELANIAADYEISNRGYTDADKVIVRSIILGDKVLRGLVTEDDYPDWENKTFEEMYIELLKMHQQDQQKLSNIIQKMQSVSQRDLDDLEDDIEQEISDKSSAEDNDKENSDSQDSQLSDADKKKLNRLKGAVSDIQDKVDELENSGGKGSDPFPSDEEQIKKAKLAERVAEIKRAFEDITQLDKIEDENRAAQSAEKIARAARDVERYNSNPIRQFKLSLNRFIADQVSEDDYDSYSRIHPSYEDSEFILPGKITRESKNIPLINVYFDVSGSFSNPEKTASARKAIASLNQYVNNGDIEIAVYYFADRVSDTQSGAGGGTQGTPILNHVEKTKPNNVIVITDGDITDCRSTVTVPGAVWMLFYGSRSENIMSHLRGKKQNKYFDIYW